MAIGPSENQVFCTPKLLHRKKLKFNNDKGNSTMKRNSDNQLNKHAIVIGSSIAGLSAARVLTNHFERVTVIERDEPAQSTLFRKGAPQGRHPHVMLKGGELALEQLFPGLRQ